MVAARAVPVTPASVPPVALPPASVYAALESQPSGLTVSDAAARLSRAGPNTIQEIRGKPLIVRFAANFTHLMALLLWAGGMVAFVAQLPQLGIAIWLVNLINGAFSFWQEYRAERATAALKRLLPPYARVLRDGQEQRVLAETLVPGDVLLLGEGDRISADARLVRDAELRVDQSTLSGEAHPVRKHSAPVQQAGLVLPELPNLVFSGTSVSAGTGRAVVYATGMATQFGQIARLTQTVGEAPSPLQREMARATRVVTIIAVAVGAIVFVLALALAGFEPWEGFIFALGMIVAFVPEGMVPTVTLALAMGVQRMARRHALIKRLSAVETLGCTTVIGTDKTGTLTQNEMTVSDLWLPGGVALAITGAGYAPEGQVISEGAAVAPDRCAGLAPLLQAASLCNNARLVPPDAATPRWTVLGDPTEAALKVAAMKAAVDLDVLAHHQPRVRELPFESRRKRMATIHQRGGARVAYVKGAPQETLALCTQALVQGAEAPLDQAARETALAANDALARRGLRVLAVAQRALPADMRDMTSDAVEQHLTFLGLVAMMDPPRPEVAEAVARCHRAGVRIVMVTGDYGLTAESIARRIGVVRSSRPRIITGGELAGMQDADLSAALEGEVIFARVAPEDKLRVVTALQAQGHIVAVTGDGVNDAPALKKADIGVAMGRSGTDVAKEAADMVLTDDNFASIVNAVEEGRAVYANARKFITYIFTSNTPEAWPFILFAFSRAHVPLALTVMQILAIDLGTDMVPALALGAEPPEPGVMERPPRSLREHVITRGVLTRAYLWLGTVQSLAAMAAFYFHYWASGYWGQWTDLPSTGTLYAAATAMTLAAVVATQIGNLFTQRTERTSILRLPWFTNRLLWVGIGSELCIITALVYLPPLQWIFGTAAFPAAHWLFLLAWTPSLVLVDEARKALLRWRVERSDRRTAFSPRAGVTDMRATGGIP